MFTEVFVDSSSNVGEGMLLVISSSIRVASRVISRFTVFPTLTMISSMFTVLNSGFSAMIL